MSEILAILNKKGFHYVLSSYSALDQYFRIKEPGALYINTDASLIALAKEFEGLSYPGLPFADALLNHSNTCVYFRCVDDLKKPFPEPFTALTLLYNSKREVFLDPLNNYRDIRLPDLISQPGRLPPDVVLIEAAKLISRYHYKIDDTSIPESTHSCHLEPDMQKHLLISILNGQYPWKGFAFLNRTGLVEKYWPELYSMHKVTHSKDYHPEGDVWEHTLETLRYRKKNDLTLSLALLLHDIGKPVAIKTVDRPFHKHSEIGARVAQRFCARLGFSREMQDNIYFLVRHHMIPGALMKLPLYRTEKLMDSPLFPLLLEVYRADISSTFIGPEGYYDACRIYKKYIKNRKNPYRTVLPLKSY
ncbi:MAG: HD domain-containing protein [Spirochaetales bacterium]|nr:HD domain-containing protein [Spirochaetales bacterium]